MVQKGDIGYSGKRKWSFFASSVKFFTKSKWSHTFFLLGDVAGYLSVQEADLQCHVVPWQREYEDSNKDYYEIWRPIKASEEAIDIAIMTCYMEYSGALYGFLQIPWFAIRGILKFFGLNASRWNWNSDGVICSELTYDYIFMLGKEYEEFVNGMTPDEVSPEDLYKRMLSRPDLFQLIALKA